MRLLSCPTIYNYLLIKMEDKMKKHSKIENKSLVTFRKNSTSYAQMLQYEKDQMKLFSDDTIACFCVD